MTDAEFQSRQQSRVAIRARYASRLPLGRRTRRERLRGKWSFRTLAEFARGIRLLELEWACRMAARI